MSVQTGLGLFANLFLIVIALIMLAMFSFNEQLWSVTAGQPLGWIALILLLVALYLRGRLHPQAAGLAGLAAVGLLGCTVRGLQPCWHLNVDPIWGYRTLTLGWAIYALLIVVATWWIASLRDPSDASRPPENLIDMAAESVRVAALLAFGLGLKAAVLDEGEQLWAAAAIAIASMAAATMAVWRRREDWAFAAGLGVNVAASIVVWHFEIHRANFVNFWQRLVQANIIASAAFAVAWLSVRRRMYQLLAH